MSGLAYLFPTFTMRADGGAELGRRAPGLGADLTTVRREVEAHVRVPDEAFRVPSREDRLSAAATLHASYACLIESLACARWSERELGAASVATSFSMGLFGALVHGEALRLGEAVDLLTGMHTIASAHCGDRPFVLAAVIGPSSAWVRERLADRPELELSVEFGHTLSLACGPRAEVEAWLDEIAGPEVRGFAFPVALPFHTSHLAAAEGEVARLVAAVDVRAPRHSIVSSSTAEPMADADDVRAELIRNIAHPIRWRAALDRVLGDGVRRFVECGLSRELGDLLVRDEGEHVQVHQFVASQVSHDTAEGAR